jgi:hypothetical protein
MNEINLKKIALIIEWLLDSEDSTGCSADLTVVSSGAVEELREAFKFFLPVK